MHVLMVVTSHDRVDESHPTGLWFEEFAIPYAIFRESGIQVTVASPLGGQTPLDPNSRPTPEQESRWVEAQGRLQDTLALDALTDAGYDAVFLPGGHGTMFDLPDNDRLRQLLQQMEAQGRVIAAVCHGPAGLVNVRREDGRPLVEGRRVTGFTDAEEREVQLDTRVPFLLETRLRELGARFEAAPNWTDHTLTDGNLVTGQNPQSSASCARAVVEALLTAAVTRAAA